MFVNEGISSIVQQIFINDFARDLLAVLKGAIWHVLVQVRVYYAKKYQHTMLALAGGASI